jgi:hypothetical protein
MTTKWDFEKQWLVQQGGVSNSIFLFFVDMLKDSSQELAHAPSDTSPLLPVSKYYLARGYFWLNYVCLRLLAWLTRYFPFSLLFQDRMIHARNQPIDKLMRRIEDAAESAGLPLRIVSGQDVGQCIELTGFITGRVRGKAELMKKTEVVLAKQSVTAFLSNDGNRLKVIVSAEAVDSL